MPITPSVLEWAIRESGLTVPEVSTGVEGGEEAVQSWLKGTEAPSLTAIKLVARRLHRQVATFLLPRPPRARATAVQFRHPLGDQDRPLNPTERRFLRRARRWQDVQRWLQGELSLPTPVLPVEALTASPSEGATIIRRRLSITVDQQIAWKSASSAFDAWRSAVEALGVSVLLFPLGGESCRGFSLADEDVPVIAVNTAWRDEARIYTLFHELGHLITRTSSACELSDASMGDARDPAERWCERFAADVLLPSQAVDRVGPVTDLSTLAKLARRFHVGLRAMAIRLIEADKATWKLYRSIPNQSDAKRDGGGGAPRNRREIREDELGGRGTGLLVEAVRREVLSVSQALDYLDIPSDEFFRLAGPASLES